MIAMKKTMKYLLLGAAAASVAVACSDWTEMEQKFPADMTNIHEDDYYANLRAYRESEHEIMFGYWQGFGGASSSYEHSLMGLPDSLDMVSMWGAGFNYSEAQMADLRMAHEKKGIKCLMVFICHSVGTQISPDFVQNASEENPARIWDAESGEYREYTDWQSARRAFWGMSVQDGPNNTPEQDAMAIRAVERYADSLCYLIDKLELDGFDWDFEPGYETDGANDIIGSSSNISAQQGHDRTLAFARRMRENLGDKIFMIDGVPQQLKAPEACIYFDYFSHQAYGNGSNSLSESAMDKRYGETVTAFSPYLKEEEIAKRTILVENFMGQYEVDGKTYYGYANWTLRDGTKPISADKVNDKTVITVNDPNYIGGSFEGMARWRPIVDGRYVRKGGIGAYLLNNEYLPDGWDTTWPMTRKCIQIMNPALE